MYKAAFAATRAVHASWRPFLFLRGFGLRIVGQAFIHPIVKVAVHIIPFFRHIQKTLHRFAAVDHWRNAPFCVHPFIIIGIDAHHEAAVGDAEEHFVVHHEADSAEHFLFLPAHAALAEGIAEAIQIPVVLWHGNFFPQFSD